MLQALNIVTFLTSRSVLESSVDPWNNVKIPYLDEISEASEAFGASGPGREQSWVPRNTLGSPTWVSLGGLMMQGIPETGNTTFFVETSYLDVKCSASRRHLSLAGDGWFVDSTFKLHLNNGSVTFPGPKLISLNSTTLSLDTISEPSMPSATSDPVVDDEEMARLRVYKTPLNLVYGSVADLWTNHTVDPTTLFNCTIMQCAVDANIGCEREDCLVTHLRPADRNTVLSAELFSGKEYDSLLRHTPVSLSAFEHNQTRVSSVDKYMLGIDAPLCIDENKALPQFANLSTDTFSKRLTIFINTVWQGSLCPHDIARGASANFSDPRRPVLSANTTATEPVKKSNILRTSCTYTYYY